MIEGMENYVGLKLKESAVKYKQESGNEKGYYIITRPDFYSDSIHINMYIHFNEDRVITDFNGDKCYSVYRGMYDRSAAVYDRDFTKRDIQYLRKFVRENVEALEMKKMKKHINMEEINMKEISRQSHACIYKESKDILTYGTIEAEIAVEDEGKPVYLHAEWVSEAPKDLLLEATTESIISIYSDTAKRTAKAYDKLPARRNKVRETKTIKEDSRYKEYYKELKKMIIKTLKESKLDEYVKGLGKNK